MAELLDSFGIWVQIIVFLFGLALIVFGADFLVDGASAIARKAGISEFVIGLTIVGMGTSMPEMVVSMLGAIQGNGDIAVGNVVGSNIFNVLLILGLTALIMPIGITPSNKKRDIPINIAVTIIFLILGSLVTPLSNGGPGLTRGDGALFLVLFAVYLWVSFKFDSPDAEEGVSEKKLSTPAAIVAVVGGLAALIFGGNLFVNSATTIAKEIGVSDKFIAVTILAGGTSMPELATCIVAAVKKKSQLALGNILGSNVFNILLILGGSALIHPLSTSGMDPVDLGVLLLSSLVILGSAYTGKNMKIGKMDGAFMLLCMAAYFGWLIYRL